MERGVIHHAILQKVLFIAIVVSFSCPAYPAPAAERLSVTSPIANIRSGPGTNHAVLWQVEKCHPLQIIEKSGDWYQFEDFEGDRGWIHKSIVGPVSTVITKKPDCNIRSGPGTKYPIVFIAEQGIPFMVLRRQGKWIEIRHADGDSGWIHHSLVW